MKYARFEKNGKTMYGEVRGDTIYRVDGDLFAAHNTTDEAIPLNQVKLLAPVQPSKVIGMGINYFDFIQKMSIPQPQFPYIFLKAPTTVVATGDAVCIPEDDSVNFEAELVAVIKDKCKNVSEADALDHVFGFTCCNDMTDRTDLLRDNHMGVSKNYDTFLPLGPVIETEMSWENVGIKLELNGETKIDGNTNNMIFKLPTQIAFISSIMTLNPGDIILTGSPAGASPVKNGDVMKISIEGIGTLVSPVKNR